MTDPIKEDDIGDLDWIYEVSGLGPARIVPLAKSGQIPGAFKLSAGPRSWRFLKPEFLKWLQTQIQTPAAN